MPSLKDLKNRIGSVKSTQKITSAMKMVAAAKLRKAQEQALASRPYTSLMDSVVSKISSKAIGSSIDLLNGKEIKTHLLVVFSADRGLCGGFNGSITRTVRSEIKKLKDDGINVKLLMVGKKSADALNREFGDLFVEKIDGNSAKPNYTDAEVLAKKIIDLFENNEFGVCRVIFNKFVSAITQEVTFKYLILVKILIIARLRSSPFRSECQTLGQFPHKLEINFFQLSHCSSCSISCDSFFTVSVSQVGYIPACTKIYFPET